MIDVSRDTFYRYKEALEDSGVEALLDINCRPPSSKNRVDLKVEEAFVAYAVKEPPHG